MKARINALAWRLLPYVCIAPFAALLVAQLLEIFGAAI